MRRRRDAGALLLVSLLLFGAAPVETHTDEGVIDWTRRVARVVGVGTPTILSPTGSLTERDPYEAARADARARLSRLLASLPVDERRRLGGIERLQPRVERELERFGSPSARYFSDGTVHLPAELSLAWVPPALSEAQGPPAPAPGDGEASGLLLLVHGPARPALRLTLRDEKESEPVHAGLPWDRVGASGLLWATSADAPQVKALVGPRPKRIEARAGEAPGQLVVSPADLAVLRGVVPGGVAVVVGEPKVNDPKGESR